MKHSSKSAPGAQIFETFFKFCSRSPNPRNICQKQAPSGVQQPPNKQEKPEKAANQQSSVLPFFRSRISCRERKFVLPFFRSRIDRREWRFVLPFFRSRMYRREQQIMHFPSPPQAGPDPWHMPGPGGMRVALTINLST